eukprot:CAMPEP_0204607654 /NCGR_PEP_ID=MMETSP0661-20131031/59843_1 /ASSEMBLY_ACC=CAM_ASM_000606 /TAXON_ID=109239 /ORGANISM="Alexandrium margalefi, Strain AMGDE01CS-322" /LENGTH=34 /DNA_ID= /DNA_START= /DNA_END= /DNA_ORIENTATION=
MTTDTQCRRATSPPEFEAPPCTEPSGVRAEPTNC